MRQDRPIDPVRDRKRFQAFAGLKRRERKWWNDRNVSAALKRRENGTLWHLRPESQEEIGDGLALSKARNLTALPVSRPIRSKIGNPRFGMWTTRALIPVELQTFSLQEVLVDRLARSNARDPLNYRTSRLRAKA